MDITRDITWHYIARLRHHTDELGLVVQGHLLIEFILNEIIRKAFRHPATILNDHRTYTFATKAQILYSTNQIPEHIFRNIRRINQIRNHLAHKLDPCSDFLDYTFSRDDEQLKGEIKVRDSKTKRRATPRKYIKMLCLGTLTQLRSHFFFQFGEFPSPKEKEKGSNDSSV